MRRYTAPYLFSYYAPLCAMVLVSWISFTVPVSSVPGRVGLLVTVFLVLSTFFGNIQVLKTPEMNILKGVILGPL